MTRPKVFEQTTMKLADLKRGVCVWEGCTANFEIGAMPRGWRFLLTYYAPQPIMRFIAIPAGDVDWDGALCPEHARMLNAQLKERETLGPMPTMGEA